MKREKFQTRKFLLKTGMQQNALLALVPNLPLDDARPIEVVVREEVKTRKLDQNALYWVGPLADIAEQAYVGGRTYSADIWHENYKRLYLPEQFDADLCKEGYVKWAYTPSGDRVCVGSTTQLTIKGFAQYLAQIEADGASMGVLFHANPRERAA